MLSPIKSKTSVRRMVFLDTETRGYPTDLWNGKGSPKLHLLRLGWALFWDSGVDRAAIEFKTPDSFFEHLEAFIGRNAESTWIYTYNASFDYQVLGVIKRVAEREGWSLSSNPIDKPFIIEARYQDSPVWFLDMGNHLGVRPRLQQIGDELGFPKGDIDASRLDDYTDDEVSPYCKRDAEIVKEYMLRWLNFLKDNDLGPYRPSIAAQCLTTFRHRFIDNPIFIHHHPMASKVEREAYRGGRNEAFFIGDIDEAYKLDVNSFHPYIMANLRLPCRLRAGVQHPRTRTLSKLLEEDRLFIVKGKVFSPAPVVSVRRVVAPHIERTVFPVGTFPATITSNEYAQLIASGGKMLDAEIVLVYDSAILFKSYIDFFYNKRLEYKADGNKTLDSMSKYFMNSLEGKFAQHVPASQEVSDAGNMTIVDHLTRDEYHVKTFGKRSWVYSKTKYDSANTFTAISAFIRAYTRTILWEDMEYIRKAGGHVFYTDTDSLFCDDLGFEALMKADRVDPKRLGAYKLEERGSLRICGAKDYLFNGKRAIKGIRDDAVEEDGVFRQTYFERMSGMRRRGVDEGIIIVENFEKVPTRIYHKGRVPAGGGWVLPLEFDE